MAKLYVTEYNGEGTVVGGMPMTPGTENASSPITIAADSAASAAFAADTEFVRLHTDAVCSIKFGVAPVATAANQRMAANSTEFFAIMPGQKVAVITNT